MQLFTLTPEIGTAATINRCRTLFHVGIRVPAAIKTRTVRREGKARDAPPCWTRPQRSTIDILTVRNPKELHGLGVDELK